MRSFCQLSGASGALVEAWLSRDSPKTLTSLVSPQDNFSSAGLQARYQYHCIAQSLRRILLEVLKLSSPKANPCSERVTHSGQRYEPWRTIGLPWDPQSCPTARQSIQQSLLGPQLRTMSTVEGQITVNDLAKDPVSHSAKRKAAQLLLEASFEKPAASHSFGQAGSAAALLTPEASQPPVKRRRTESDLPFQQRDSTLTAGTGCSWRDVCQSFTACNLSLLANPDARNPQQLLLTQKGVTVVLVDRPAQAAAAVALLRASMQDHLLGLDLEWQADTSPTSRNPVSLVQIASTTCCLLVRTCSLKFKLPPEILNLLRCIMCQCPCIL